MKILTQKQISKLSYLESVRYYQELKNYKFGNIEEGTPLIRRYPSGKITIIEYRLSGTTDFNGFKHLVYGKNSCHGYTPDEVELATKEDIEEYIELKENEFKNILKHYQNLKEKVYVNY